MSFDPQPDTPRSFDPRVKDPASDGPLPLDFGESKQGYVAVSRPPPLLHAFVAPGCVIRVSRACRRGLSQEEWPCYKPCMAKGTQGLLHTPEFWRHVKQGVGGGRGCRVSGCWRISLVGFTPLRWQFTKFPKPVLVGCLAFFRGGGTETQRDTQRPTDRQQTGTQTNKPNRRAKQSKLTSQTSQTSQANQTTQTTQTNNKQAKTNQQTNQATQRAKRRKTLGGAPDGGVGHTPTRVAR